MKRLVLVGMSVAALCAQAGGADYPVKAADMTNVTITAGFWLPRFETNRVVTVKADFEKSEETGRLANFREAAKRAQGTFKGCPFDDSDVFKIIEGAAYTLATHPDPKLEKYLDDLIADIAGAQEPDGYLYTARTLGMEKVKGFPRAGMMGPERWSNTGASHEFYNMGHMIEAGVAYWQVTGKRQLLDVAIKAADMMDRTFGYGPGQIQRVPGHEEIELALCKLYRATGEVRYLKLAKTLLDFRGGGKAYNQNHLPVTQQDQACGHAVRAGYLYTAMADVAALLGDPSYRVASERLWKDVVDTKLHLNGGIGAHRHAVVPGFGSVGEAFGAPYDLPNESAYLETCAAIANALWNERLFLFSGDGKYMDVIERIIYNGFLSGISMSGDEFFYPNPLASALRHLDVRRRVLLPQPARLRRRLRALEVVRLQLLPRERGALHPADRAVRLRDVRQHGLREPLRRERREAQPRGRHGHAFTGNGLPVERQGQGQGDAGKDGKRTTARQIHAQRAHSGMVRGASRAQHALRTDRAEFALELQSEGEWRAVRVHAKEGLLLHRPFLEERRRRGS